MATRSPSMPHLRASRVARDKTRPTAAVVTDPALAIPPWFVVGGCVSSSDLDAYFARIAYDGPRAATFEVLCALHRHHVCAIPFENLDVLLDRGIRIDLASVTRKLVTDHRGGYCFEQNTLFAAVLRTLGFEVITLGGRVRWKVPDEVPTARTHMILLVHCDGRRHLCDVGFGGLSLSTPIDLDVGTEQRSGHESRRVSRRDGEYVHQVLRHGHWLDVYRFTLEPHGAVDYELANWYTATHPASRFRQNLVAALAAEDRHYTLANHGFNIRHADGRVEKTVIASADELLDVLRSRFGLHFPAGTRFGPPGSPWPR